MLDYRAKFGSSTVNGVNYYVNGNPIKFYPGATVDLRNFSSRSHYFVIFDFHFKFPGKK